MSDETNMPTEEETVEAAEAAEVTPAPSLATTKLDEIKKKMREMIIKRKMEEEGMSQKDAEADADKALAAAVQKADDVAGFNPREFDHDFLKVYLDEPFLGTISLQISKRADFDAPTAYVGARPSGKQYDIVMGYNPNFLRSLSPRQRQGVVKHEMYHLIFQHIFSRAPGDKHYQTLWNWATDMAINSIIGAENLPDACIIPGKASINPATGKEITGPYADYIKSAPKMQSSDHYFDELRKIEEEEQKKGNSNSIQVAVGQGLNSIDDHGAWDNIPKEVQEQLRDAVRGMAESAAKKAQRSNSWGSVPHEIQEIINKLLSHEIDWRSILRQFIGRCRTMDRNSTIKRINKKVPYLFPGYVRKYMANFACFIDQSGSMSDEDISMLFSELEGFAQQTEIEVFHFDTEIDENSRTTWKKGRPFPPAHRTRCGGTNFQAVADFCNRPENRGKWAGIVLLTDGYAPKMGQIIGSKVIWVITEHGDMSSIRKGDLGVQMKSETKTFKRY